MIDVINRNVTIHLNMIEIYKIVPHYTNKCNFNSLFAIDTGEYLPHVLIVVYL